MNIDLSLTITGIIALCAIISPILTAVINNHYKLKLNLLETYTLKRREILLSFIDTVIECSDNLTNGKLSNSKYKEYCKASEYLLVYFPELDSNFIESMTKHLKLGDSEFLLEHLSDITSILSKCIKIK